MIRYPLTYNPILEYNAAIENGQVVVSKKVATVYRKLAQDVVNGCGDYAYKAKRANHAIACDALANAYMRKTGKTRDEIRAMMDAETWVDARRAVELGLVDEVMGGDLVAADVPGLLPESVVQKTLAMFRDQNAAALAQAKTDYENLIKKGVV